MSPNRINRGGKPVSNIYTVILGLALCAVIATVAFVAVKCQLQYETFYAIP